MADGLGKRFEGANWEEALGAVSTHEVYHSDWKQIALDFKTPKEVNQNPKNGIFTSVKDYSTLEFTCYTLKDK